MPDMEFVQKYVLEEMKAIRTRIDAEIAYINQLEILSVTTIGAVFLLLFQYHITDRAVGIVLACIAFTVSVYGYYRFKAHDDIIHKYNVYLMMIENMVRQGDYDSIGLVSYWQTSKKVDMSRFENVGRGKRIRLWFWRALAIIVLLLMVLILIMPGVFSGPPK